MATSGDRRAEPEEHQGIALRHQRQAEHGSDDEKSAQPDPPASDVSGAPDLVTMVGDAQGRVYRRARAGEYDDPSNDWVLVGDAPGTEAIIALATDQTPPTDPTVPAGLIYPVYAATSKGVYRSP